METQKFVLGRDSYPDWFKKLSDEGNVYFKTSESGELERITIKTFTGPKEAVKGDTIVYLGEESEKTHSIQVITPETASKYMR